MIRGTKQDQDLFVQGTILTCRTERGTLVMKSSNRSKTDRKMSDYHLFTDGGLIHRKAKCQIQMALIPPKSLT